MIHPASHRSFLQNVGSHGLSTDEFITAILKDRKPLIDVTLALNRTVARIVAHQSALKNGELLKIPQFS